MRSLVKAVTNVLTGNELETPLPDYFIEVLHKLGDPD